jgi:hypothetical protein
MFVSENIDREALRSILGALSKQSRVINGYDIVDACLARIFLLGKVSGKFFLPVSYTLVILFQSEQ